MCVLSECLYVRMCVECMLVSRVFYGICFVCVCYGSVLPAGMEDWYMVDYCEESYWDQFFQLLHSGRVDELRIELGRIVSSNTGWRCATAVAAGCVLLGKRGSLILNQLAAIYLSFDYTMKGLDWITNSRWGIRWDHSVSSVLNAMNSHQKNTPEFRNLTMRQYLALNECGDVSTALSIAIVTVCDYNSDVTPLAALSKLNKQQYAEKHGYTLFFYEKAPTYRDWWTVNGDMYPDRPAAWSKIDAMLNVIGGEENFDWVMWMDCDSFFMDMSVGINQVVGKVGGGSDFEKISQLAKWTGKNLTEYNNYGNSLLESSTSVELIISEDGLMLNSGIFFLRKSIFSYIFLQKIRQFTFFKNPATWHSWWEQTAMVIIMSRDVWMRDAVFDWPPYVFMYTQKQLNVYPPLIASMLKTHVPYTVGDYIVSFSGCKIYTSQSVCNELFLSYFNLSHHTHLP